MKSQLYILFKLLFMVIPFTVSSQTMIISTNTYVTQSGGYMVQKGDMVNNGDFNHSGGTVVFSGTNQSISGTTPYVFNNLTVASGTVLTIPARINVDVNGTLVNNNDTNGLVIQSTHNGTGSLIHSTAGVKATVQRYLSRNHWHVTSSPLTGQLVSGFVTDVTNHIPTSGTNYGMMYYSESLGGWQYYTNTASGYINSGNGYLIRHSVDDSVRFFGTLNAANVDVDIARVRYGWNCIGNPFPCSIGVRYDAISDTNFLNYNASALDPSFAALYLWDEPAVRITGVDYYKVICNASFLGRENLNQAYLQPGQGFIIKAKENGTVSFTTDMRIHENTASYFKSYNTSAWSGLNVLASYKTKTASTAISFHNGMTRGLDVTYDVGLLGGDPTFRIYSRLVDDNGINFMLQCLPDNDFTNLRIPLGIDFKDGGYVTFTAESFSLPAGFYAILVDSLMKTATDIGISGASYTATVGANTSGPGRFFLNISNSLTDFYDIINYSYDIYTSEKNIIIKGKVIRKTKAVLYDLTGRAVRTYLLKESDINFLDANDIQSGIYIIKLYGEGITDSKKIYL